MRGTYLAIPPCGRQASEKALKVGVAVRQDMQHLAFGKAGKMFLDDSDLVEKPQRIECREHGTQPLLHLLVNGKVSR